MFIYNFRWFIITLFYLIDLFESLFMILFGLNNFYYASYTSFASAKVITYSISMQIAVLSYKFSSRVIKLVIMFFLKFLKIDMNIISKTIVFDIFNCIFIQLIYCILVRDIIVSCFNNFTILIKDFKIIGFKFVYKCIENAKKISYYKQLLIENLK